MNIEDYAFEDVEIGRVSVDYDENNDFESICLIVECGYNSVTLPKEDIKALAIAAGLIKQEGEEK